MATGVSIASLEWGNRTRDTFIDKSIKNSKVLDLFTLIDGVKNKIQVPIFTGALEFGNELCVFDPKSSVNIDEKEMSVTNWKWAFQNCKTVLQTTYRSIMLKKGANTPESMDADFAAWVFDFFAKKTAEKLVNLAATEIKAEIAGDADVAKPAQGTGSISASNVLAKLQAAYEDLPSDLLNQLYGGSDRDYMPVIFGNANFIRFYQIAIANAYTTVYDGLSKGTIMPYLGMDVVLFNTLADDEFIITNPANFVMITDDYADVEAIQAQWEPKISADYIWGQFTVGFSYLISENILYSTHGA